MNWIVLSAIIAWSVFWLGYALYIYNSECFYIKFGKKCTKSERPLLFHAEILASAFWSLSGYAMLYAFLRSSI
jgi:hypothetical protein